MTLRTFGQNWPSCQNKTNFKRIKISSRLMHVNKNGIADKIKNDYRRLFLYIFGVNHFFVRGGALLSEFLYERHFG